MKTGINDLDNILKIKEEDFIIIGISLQINTIYFLKNKEED